MCAPSDKIPLEFDSKSFQLWKPEDASCHLLIVGNNDENEDQRVNRDAPSNDGSNRMQRPVYTFCISNLLTSEECDFLQNLMEQRSESNDVERLDYIESMLRADRLLLWSHPFARILYRRIEPFLKKFVGILVVDGEEQHWEGAEVMDCQDRSNNSGVRDSIKVLSPFDEKNCIHEFGWEGRWKAVGMNWRFSFLRYHSGGDSFLAHTDGCIEEEDEGQYDDLNGLDNSEMKKMEKDETCLRTVFTTLFYLNDDFSGGSTNILSHESELDYRTKAIREEEWDRYLSGRKIHVSVHPGEGGGDDGSTRPLNRFKGGRGSCLIFLQKGMLHDADKITSGTKYVMRSDITFRRVEAPKMSENERQAREYLAEAVSKESEGKLREAQILYNRAFHLEPKLERCV